MDRMLGKTCETSKKFGMNIGGSKGMPETSTPLGPISFIFMQFLGKKLAELSLPNSELAGPRKSWIRHR